MMYQADWMAMHGVRRRQQFKVAEMRRQHDHPERRNGPYSGVSLLICILLVKVQTARSNAEEKPVKTA